MKWVNKQQENELKIKMECDNEWAYVHCFPDSNSTLTFWYRWEEFSLSPWLDAIVSEH